MAIASVPHVGQWCDANVTSVRSANRAFYQTFHVSPEETVNRLIYELGNGQWDIPGLRTLLHGGEPCPPPVKEAIADWFGEVLVEYYGFTEGGMTVVRADEWRSRPGRRPMRTLPGAFFIEQGSDGFRQFFQGGGASEG